MVILHVSLLISGFHDLNQITTPFSLFLLTCEAFIVLTTVLESFHVTPKDFNITMIYLMLQYKNQPMIASSHLFLPSLTPPVL